jgi:glycerol-3-phosphate O-acyltransferase
MKETIEVTTTGVVHTGDPIVVVFQARSNVEHDLVERWARDAQGDRAELVRAEGRAIAERLTRGDDPLVVPVRVAWLPRERNGDRRARWSDAVALTNPRRPRPRSQRRIAAREPDRCRVVVGEPASATEMRGVWARETGGVGGPAGFAEWLSRRAVLALERAERAVAGDRYKVPRLVAEQITDSAGFRREVAALADRLDQPVIEVARRAAEGLREMAAVQSRLGIDLFAAAMRPLHARAWDVRVDVASLDALRELNRSHALVFLPSHRSYADGLILARILYEHEFPPNHVFGGANMAFWPLGPLGRRAGLVFIRRSFRDDEVYKLALREYVGYLAGRRFNLEWYIEGGRSRTGKLRPPRYGLLRYLVEAIESGRAEDVCLVPVSITYDQLKEVQALAEEDRGALKKSEGLGWLARYVRAQQRRTGTVYVRFGEPLTVSERLGATQRLAMEKMAFEVCVRINRATPVVATSLVTLALLGVRDRALTLEEVRCALAPLLDYVEARTLPVGEGVGALRRSAGVQHTLSSLVREGVVHAHASGTEAVFAIHPGQHHVAAFYRNSASHWLVNRAIAELSLLGPDPIEEALTLRALLEHEFFFAEKATFRDEIAAELALIDPRWAEREGRDVLAEAPLLVADRVLGAFLDAYLVVAERLAEREPRLAVDHDALLDECAAVGEQLVLQRQLRYPESVSRELFRTALRVAAQRDLVDPGREELTERRRAFAEEVAAVVSRVAVVAELEARCTTS